MKCGEHGSSFEKPSRGICSVWVKKVDDLLENGIMPKKVYNLLMKESTDENRVVIPTVAQLQNRKKFLFRSDLQLDTTHALEHYLKCVSMF
jgi:hypothetical protein